jgi:hypothetical protein
LLTSFFLIRLYESPVSQVQHIAKSPGTDGSRRYGINLTSVFFYRKAERPGIFSLELQTEIAFPGIHLISQTGRLGV